MEYISVIEKSIKISENYIENEKLSKLIMKFSIPCVLAMVVNAFYSIKLGEKNKEEGAKAIGNAITLMALLGLIFLTAGLNSIICVDGSPEYLMLDMIVGAVINIILNPIFIFHFGMGVKGSAIETLIGHIVTGILITSELKKYSRLEV